jgi:hypothetical protein
MIGITQWRRLSVRCSFGLTFIRVMQHVQSLSVRGHQSILDAVMHHLHEVAGAGLTAMQVTISSRTRISCATRCRRNCLTSRRESFEDGIEISNDVFLAANHLAVTTIESPNSTACPHVDIMNAFSFEFVRATNVVDVIRVSAVDDDVSGG